MVENIKHIEEQVIAYSWCCPNCHESTELYHEPQAEDTDYCDYCGFDVTFSGEATDE